MNNKLITFVLIGVVILGLGYYFMNKNSMKSNSVSQPQTTTIPSTPGGATSSTLPAVIDRTINIEGNEYAFNPSAITVKKGQNIQITFTNTGALPHNLKISDLNVQTKTIQPGQSDTVTFTAEIIGKFNFICSVGSHADKGMKGVLTVE